MCIVLAPRAGEIENGLVGGPTKDGAPVARRAGMEWMDGLDGWMQRPGRASGHALDLTSSLRGIPSVPLWRCREARLDARFADGDTLDAFGAHSDYSYTYSPLV